MIFQVLGAGGAVPTVERFPAAYWVEVDAHGLLLDPGPGAVVRLLRSELGPEDVDQIETILLTTCTWTTAPSVARHSIPDRPNSIGKPANCCSPNRSIRNRILTIWLRSNRCPRA